MHKIRAGSSLNSLAIVNKNRRLLNGHETGSRRSDRTELAAGRDLRLHGGNSDREDGEAEFTPPDNNSFSLIAGV